MEGKTRDPFKLEGEWWSSNLDFKGTLSIHPPLDLAQILHPCSFRCSVRMQSEKLEVGEVVAMKGSVMRVRHIVTVLMRSEEEASEQTYIISAKVSVRGEPVIWMGELICVYPCTYSEVMRCSFWSPPLERLCLTI